jgi:CubicO group peptidase (beta-lactamase class C family)
MRFDAAARVIEEAIGARVFPAAVAEVGASGGVLWRDAFGRLTFDAESAPTAVDTPFDLASLTKVMATTSVVMQLMSSGTLRLAEPVSAAFREWRGPDRESVTVRDLLEHASGLPARLVDAPPTGRREFEHEICVMPLEYEPRSRSIYSDLGFILLGFLAEDRGGASLGAQFDTIHARVVGADPPARSGADTQVGYIGFGLPPELRRFAAPTLPLDDDSRRGRVLRGEVHDNYAAALAGVAGHAGLFGSAAAVGRFGLAVLRAARGQDEPAPFSPALVAAMTTKSAVLGSSRALGWDTMLPTSSCGTRMSPAAFGHVGFTGTSLWIDPVRDRYYVLLANRACGGGSVDAVRDVRRAFHDALADA